MILDFNRTLSYVEARISQMGDILAVRAKDTEQDSLLFLTHLGLNRFEHLEAIRKYINDLIIMTTKYVQGTLELLQSLYDENLQREFKMLKITTFLAAVTSFFGMNIAFPWEERWSMISLISFVVVGIIIIAILLFYLYIKHAILNREFKISSSSISKKPL